MPIEIAHLTIDGKEIDEKHIKNNEVTTQKAMDVVNMFNANNFTIKICKTNLFYCTKINCLRINNIINSQFRF